MKSNSGMVAGTYQLIPRCYGTADYGCITPIESKWTCSYCGTKNNESNNRCCHCGGPS